MENTEIKGKVKDSGIYISHPFSINNILLSTVPFQRSPLFYRTQPSVLVYLR